MPEPRAASMTSEVIASIYYAVGGTALNPSVDLHGAGLDEVVGDRPATARLGRHPTVEALVGRGHQPP